MFVTCYTSHEPYFGFSLMAYSAGSSCPSHRPASPSPTYADSLLSSSFRSGISQRKAQRGTPTRQRQWPPATTAAGCYSARQSHGHASPRRASLKRSLWRPVTLRPCKLGRHLCVGDGAHDGDAPGDAEATHEDPGTRREHRILVGRRGQLDGEQGGHGEAGADGLDDLEANLGARVGVLVQEGEEAEADDYGGKGDGEDGL
ncbi:hypothetical protein GJ744_011410 [Endocarpon pusillum]|uniref:Uncharacterized protein n=1 Tax=Endocarpon pusillum TaxID=364733 RepID=A0A8H7ADD2_9EURO|nr:hypothetical protein GJ744_011410 [Endocarpon pusillum]